MNEGRGGYLFDVVIITAAALVIIYCVLVG